MLWEDNRVVCEGLSELESNRLDSLAITQRADGQFTTTGSAVLHETALEAMRSEQTARLRYQSPRVLFIGDKESLNIRAFSFYSNQRPGSVELAGIITPGSHIDEAVQIFTTMGTNDPTFSSPHERADGFTDYEFRSGYRSFQHTHVPYDSTRIRDTNYREQYNVHLEEAISASNPDYIFLSNFKLVLPPSIVAKYANRIINVHPSVLPVLKGFRSEHKVVNMQQHSLHSGYT
ncbi:MAG: hypothetical protein KDD60_12300, partial [Bdellovibrionales bacterium]|nr:hypothetical protein [Bdellovibrionales bacterium]